MKRLLSSVLAAIVLLTMFIAVDVDAQGSLSVQVLQLLARINTWTAKQTYQDIRLATAAVPSDTADRFYADASHVLYWNGSAIAGGGASLTPHNLLSSTHSDTLAGSVARGDVIVANSTPAWGRLAKGAAGTFLRSDGTDVSYSTNGSALTSLPAANLTGTIAAISGVNLTNLNATNLASGTVPLARLSGITYAEISASAGIDYTQLDLAAAVNLSTDTAATPLPFAKGGTGLTTAADDTVPISSGSAWVAKALPNCVSATTALAYTAATNTLSCQAISVGTGTATSVAATMPAIFSVAGSPVTTAGTLAVTLATQAANLVWSGPTTGSAAAPAFRALVNADFPVTGVAAAAYSKVTVNTAGIVTGGAAASLATDMTGTLAYTNGGTGLTAAADDRAMIGSGTAWVPTTLPSCANGPLAYSTSTNGFTCPANQVLGGAVTSAAGYMGGIVDSTSTTSGSTQNTEYALNSVVLPANAFNANTRGVVIEAWGTTAANANAKDIKIYFGSVAVATVTGSTANAKDFHIRMTVLRSGSSTQTAVATIQVDTGVAPAMAVTTALVATDSATITISVKTANTAAAATSATGKGLIVLFTN